MALESKQPKLQPQDGLGTFAGVFTPSILTILGIILFMRLGYVVGSAGLRQALLIILLANSISVLTSLSLSAVATNLKVRGGGDYYLISRTLGVQFGGALGLVLFIAQAISIGFYCVGFGEVLAGMFGRGGLWPQAVALGAVASLFVLAWKGADWATRFQFVVMTVLGLALLSFFIGGLNQWDDALYQQNWLPPQNSPGFWALFAVFFPAVTGFTQGVSMSGDLRDPGKSLPLGTFLAVGVSILVYFAAALFFAGVVPQEVLIADYASMQQVAWLPFLISAGVVAATLSSAMASFLGAPRILQSLATDRIFPLLHPFAKGSGEANNPRRGVLLSAAIAVLTIGLGNLNLIAGVVSMFFLISYGLLNYATYFEARSASPSFRPRFKFFNQRLSLAGALVCLAAMLAIDWKAGLVAVAVLYSIYQYLNRSAGISRWADSRRSHSLQQLREHMLLVAKEPEHPRDWRPQILAYSDDSPRRERLLRFASWIEGGSGLTTVVRIVEGEGARALKQKAEAEEELFTDISRSGVKAFPLVVATPSFEIGNYLLLQSFGVGPLKANIILLNHREVYSNQFFIEALKAYGRNLRTAFRLGYNIVVLDSKEEEWKAIDEAAPDKRRIDVCFFGDATSSLMLMLAYLMTRSPTWEEARIRVLSPVGEEGPEATLQELAAMLDKFRIDAEPVVVEDCSDETLARHSADASLVFLPLRLRQGRVLTPAGQVAEPLMLRLPAVAMVMAAKDLQLDAEPEDGVAGIIAEAADDLAEARERLKGAEQEVQKAAGEVEACLKLLPRASLEEMTLEQWTTLKVDLERTQKELNKAIRRSAKAETRVESEERRVEQLRKKYRLPEEKPAEEGREIPVSAEQEGKNED